MKKSKENEETKYPIPGYEEYYTTKEGKIYSRNSIQNNYTLTELKGWINNDGYRMVGLMKDHKLHSIPVHKVQELVFLGGPKSGLQIDHKDGVKTNNNISNLHQVTPRENRNNPITDKKLRETLASPEYRNKLKGIMQEKFKDPEYRKRIEQAATKRLNDPKWQENHASAMKEVWSRPHMRKLTYDNLDKMNNNPEMRAYNAQRSKEVNSRKCKAINTDGKELIFNSVTECAKQMNLSTRTIARLFNSKTSSKTGWKFERLDK